MWHNFYYAWISFRWKVWRRKEKTCDVKNSILLKNLTQQNIVPLKPCNLIITFQVFIQRCVYWLSGTCFVKDKINLQVDITLLEIKFDYSVVKRRVAYFLNKSGFKEKSKLIINSQNSFLIPSIVHQIYP